MTDVTEIGGDAVDNYMRPLGDECIDIATELMHQEVLHLCGKLPSSREVTDSDVARMRLIQRLLWAASAIQALKKRP